MKVKPILSTLAILFTFALCAYNIPKGWFVAGNRPTDYNMGTDVGAGYHGGNAATIQSNKEQIDGFGTLMQNISPARYMGKRVRLTGYMKSLNIKGWAGFWLRVDKERSYNPLAFDNMSNRKVTGTTQWQKYEIVLDVPVNALNIAYGALLAGNGQIWFDQLQFAVVGKEIPTTGTTAPNDPTNMGFEN
ncbi:MAG: hypothetical protein H0X33_04990 [Taibaiella sp.]|nr:hypothetical protein [Taibaiella sp.]